MPSSSLYFLDRMEQGIKVHLGYWLARILLLIYKTPNRHLTLCHIMGIFVQKKLCPQPGRTQPRQPSPKAVQLGHRVSDKGKSHSGGTPKEMRKPSGAEARSVRKLEMRLAKLEDMENKLVNIEDAIYKTRRSQLQLLNILSQSQMYQGDSLSAVRNVVAEFMGKVLSLVQAKLGEGELEVDHILVEQMNRAFDEETRKVRQERREQAGQKTQASEEMEKEDTTRGQKPVETVTEEKTPTIEADQPAEESDQASIPQEKERAVTPPPKPTKKAPRKPQGR